MMKTDDTITDEITEPSTNKYEKVCIGNRFLHLLLFIVLIAVDQITKFLAVEAFSDGSRKVLIDEALELVYVENTGASFGIFSDGNTMFLILIPILILVMLFLYFRIPGGRHFRPMRIFAICIIAGAFGNLADRVRVKHVIDFIYIKLINFPVFNVADCYITFSAFLFAIFFIAIYRKDSFDFFSLKQDKKC